MQKRSLFYGGIWRPLGAQSAQITSTIYKTQKFVFKSALPVASAMAPESLVPVGEYKRPDAKKDVPAPPELGYTRDIRIALLGDGNHAKHVSKTQLRDAG